MRPSACAPPESFRPGAPCDIAIGAGFGAYAAALEPLRSTARLILAEAEPCAAEVALLGAADFAAGGGRDADAALPVYLRDNVAKPTA